MRIHPSVFGSFGTPLPVDQQGFTCTTAPEWRREGYDRREAVELAREARAAIRRAERLVKAWREEG